jgi:TRAP-type C4-dicarboxylate transport system substrate-binding protein
MFKWFWHSIALGALLLPAGAQAQPAKLKFAVFIPDAPVVQEVFRPFAENVNRDGKGLVEVEVFANGALGRNPLQQAQMVRDGVADMAWVILPQARGLFRETEVLELPGLFRDVVEASTVSSRMLTKGHLKGFEEFFPVGLVGTGPMSLHSRGQIKSLADLRGKKIRAAGPMESATITAMGAAPVGLTINEVIEAVGRGNVDAVTSLPSMLFDLGFNQVTNTHYFIRMGNLPMAVLMNRKKFDSLPREAQDVIRKYSGEWLATRFNQSQGPYYEALIKQLRADPKRTVVVPNEAEFAAIQTQFKPVIQEWAGRSPRNQELLKLLEQEIALVRAGR